MCLRKQERSTVFGFLCPQEIRVKRLQKSPVRRRCQGVNPQILLDGVVSVNQCVLVDVKAFGSLVKVIVCFDEGAHGLTEAASVLRAHLTAADTEGMLQLPQGDRFPQIAAQMIVEEHGLAILRKALFQPAAVAVAIAVLGIGVLKAANVCLRTAFDDGEIVCQKVPISGVQGLILLLKALLHQHMAVVQGKAEIPVRAQRTAAQDVKQLTCLARPGF